MGCLTKEEAKAKQDEITKHGFKLGWWYGTDCKQCCGVYPKFMKTAGFDDKCYYECEVCGKKTDLYEMPWQAEKAWNEDRIHYDNETISLFEVEE